MTAVLRNYDGLATVTDSMASFGNVVTGAEVLGDPFAFTVIDGAAKLELRVSDQDGLRLVRTLDLTYPGSPVALAGVGASSNIALTWARVMVQDLRGYNVYRSETQGGPYTKINPVPTYRTAYYLDSGLDALTRYYYRVAAVDSSGNESSLSAEAGVSTNPPTHTVFPIETNRNTPSSITYDHVYSGYPVAIAAGSEKLYVLHPDGSAYDKQCQDISDIGFVDACERFKGAGSSSSEGVEFFHSDSCTGSLLTTIDERTDCDSLKNMSTVWGISANEQCIDVPDRTAVAACYTLARAASPDATVFYHSDNCSGQVLVYADEKSDCRKIAPHVRSSVWGVRINGECQDIRDTDFASACAAFLPGSTPTPQPK
jgi:hypothetical protein